MVDLSRLRAAYEKVKGELLAERTPRGHWVGELSSSALATATAVSALAVVRGVQGPRSKVQSLEPGTSSTLDLGPWTLDSLIRRGVAYLVTQQNADGGFGDTDLSHSNIATTYLVVAALHLAQSAVGNALRGVPETRMDGDFTAQGMPRRAFPTGDELDALLARANAYIEAEGGLAGLRERYGIDKTFVVPIMTNLALAGLLDWRQIDPLPFELACVPQSLYRFVGMPVVSYAIPALVAIGQARYFHAPPWNPITRLIRWLSIMRSLRVLRQMQPDSGGYLEATPLTSFVVMSLASSRHAPRDEPNDSTDPAAQGHVTRSVTATADAVIRHGVKFLAASIRSDGSWPIDTNLATWNTTLAINALAGTGEDVAELLGVGAVGNALRGVPDARLDADPGAHGMPQRAFPTGRGPSESNVLAWTRGNVLDWLLSCQWTWQHPFTGADPGGFGWSDLSGAVPDADDTPGALLALAAWRESATRARADNIGIYAIADNAFEWLVRLQNRDGGWPTFCRGWGRLPFDRSGTDLTAHVLRALNAFHGHLNPLVTFRTWWNCRFMRASHRGYEYLKSKQHPDGSWSPLWFGNQDHPQEDNPVYGTAKVLFAYRDLGLMDSPEAQRGVAWLVANQNSDGGWGRGVWERADCKVQIARCKLQIGEQAERADASGVGLESAAGYPGGDSANPVPGTQYSVRGTQYAPGLADAPAIDNLQFAICNLQSSIEETALAVEALLAALPTTDHRPPTDRNAAEGRNATEGVPYSAVVRGLNWLLDRVEQNQHRQPAPIGFYFAKLWYYERLYPLTFTVAALGRACRQFAPAESDIATKPSATRAT